VKPIPPSTLRTHLAHGQAADPRPDGPHPDADQLTAFAENTLLDRERTDILAHLAVCSHCRAILHTAAAPEPEPQLESLPTRAPIRSWFPGLALAGCLFVMAASTIFFYRATRSNSNRTFTADKVSAPQSQPTPPPSIPASTTPSAPTTNTSLSSSAASGPKHSRAASRPRPAIPAQLEDPRVAAAPPPTPPTPEPSASGGELAQQAQNVPPANQSQIDSEFAAHRGAVGAAKATPSTAAPPSATETVAVQPAEAFTRSLKTTQPAVRGLIAGMALRPRFRITDSGQLERSTQSGLWSPAPIAADVRFRVLSISGSDVWAGGDHLRLFHSSDSGLTWTELQLPVTADHSHAIVHIRIDSPQHITVEDDAGSSWTTANAGATWQ